jgi:HSP20 family protein
MSPQVESYTEGTTLHLKADLPGIDPQAVELTVEGTQLTLKGERKAEQEAKDGGVPGGALWQLCPDLPAA